MTPSEEVVDVLIRDDPTVTSNDIQRAIDDIVEKSKERAPESHFLARRGAEGVGVVETIVITVITAVAKEAAVTAWKELIWPSLKLRFGNKIRRKDE